MCQPSKPPLSGHLLALCWRRPVGRDRGADDAQRGHQQDHQAPPQVAEGARFLGSADVWGVGTGSQPHTGLICLHQICVIDARIAFPIMPLMMLIYRCLALDSNLLACLERISLCGISFSRYQILPAFLGLIIFSFFSFASSYSHSFSWSHYILILFLVSYIPRLCMTLISQ